MTTTQLRQPALPATSTAADAVACPTPRRTRPAKPSRPGTHVFSAAHRNGAARTSTFEFVVSTKPGDCNTPEHKRRILSHAMRSHLAGSGSSKTRGRHGRWTQQEQATAKPSPRQPSQPASAATSYSSSESLEVPSKSAVPTDIGLPQHEDSLMISTSSPSRQNQTSHALVTLPTSERARQRRSNLHGPDKLASLYVWPGHPGLLNADVIGPGPRVSRIDSVIGSGLDPFDSIPNLSWNGRRFDDLQYELGIMCGFGAVLQADWFSPLVRTDPLANAISQIPWAVTGALRKGECEGQAVLTLKVSTLRAVQSNLQSATAALTDLTLVAIATLLCYEAWKGDYVAVDSHRQGLNRLVRRRGGIFPISTNFDLGCVVACKLVSSSIIVDQRPPPSFYHFLKNASQAPYVRNHPPWPESPLFCPSGSLLALKKNPLITSDVCESLEDVYLLTRQLLRKPDKVEDIQAAAHRIYDDILGQALPHLQRPVRAGESRRKHSAVAAIYLALLVYTSGVAHRIPLAAAVPNVVRDTYIPSPLDKISTLCQQTNFLSLWGGYGDSQPHSATGLFLFVGFICVSAFAPSSAVLREQRDCASTGVVVPAYSMRQRWLMCMMLNPVVMCTTGYHEAYMGPLCTMSEVCAWLRGEDPDSLGVRRGDDDNEDLESLLPTRT